MDNILMMRYVNGLIGYTFGNEAGWHYCHCCGKVWSETDKCTLCGRILRTKQEVLDNWIDIPEAV